MARYRRDFFSLAEAALVGLFFVQALRFVYGTLYAHVSSARLLAVTANPGSVIALPGVVSLTDVQAELIIAAVAIFGPALQWSQEPVTQSADEVARDIFVVVMDGAAGSGGSRTIVGA